MLLTSHSKNEVFQFKDIVFSDPDEVMDEIAGINNLEKAIVCYVGLDWCPPVRWTIQYLQEISDEAEFIDTLRLYILDAENEEIREFSEKYNLIFGTASLLILYNCQIVPFITSRQIYDENGMREEVIEYDAHKAPLNRNEVLQILEQIRKGVKRQELANIEIGFEST